MLFLRIAKNILRYRLAVLISVGLVTIFMVFFSTNLKFYYKPTPLLPIDDSLLIKHREFVDLFGKGENVMVIGVQDSLFFQLERFSAWRAFEDSLRKIDGVEHVFSISDIFNIVRDNEDRAFRFVRIFDSIPRTNTQAELDSLVKIAFSLPFYNNLLYNKKEYVFLTTVTLKQDFITSEARIDLIQKIVTQSETFSALSGNSIKFSGLPYIRTTIAELIKKEMFLFIGLAIAITILIIYYLFRSWRIVLISQLVVAISVIWALGLMSILNYEITLLTAVIPPLIIVIGVPNCVFLLNKYHQEYSKHGNKIKALYRSIHSIGSAIFLTNLTTAAGFGTFMVTQIGILNEFGLAASIGVMGVFVVSLLLIPSIFSYLPDPEPKHLEHLDNVRINNAITRVLVTTLYKRKTVFITALVVVFIGFIGLSRIKSNGFMVDDIPKHHPVYLDLKFFEKNFAGVMPLELVVDTKKPRGVTQETELRRIHRLQQELDSFPELSRPLSIVEAAKFARQAYFNGNPSQYKLPTGPERGFIMSYLPKKMAKNELLGRFIDSSGRYTKIIYNSADIGTIKMKALQKRIASKIDSVYGDDSNQVHIGGGSILAAKGVDFLVHSLLLSLVFAILLISLFMAWMFRNPRMVLLSVLPNLVPLLITAALMGFVGINLKPSTVIVFSIAFGISVDNSIHFLSRFRREMRRTKGNTKASVVCSIRETGFSMIYTSIVLFFGFGIFIASKFGGTVSLGLLVSSTLFVALFSNLILLPSILLSLSGGNNKEDCKKFVEAD